MIQLYDNSDSARSCRVSFPLLQQPFAGKELWRQADSESQRLFSCERLLDGGGILLLVYRQGKIWLRDREVPIRRPRHGNRIQQHAPELTRPIVSFFVIGDVQL